MPLPKTEYPFTPSMRVSESDPALRVVGHKTAQISLADEAEYDLSGIAYGRYRADMLNDERPLSVEFNVAAKAAVAFTALAKSTTVITATVASGAGEGIQTGQWMYLDPTATTADARVLRGWFIVADQTATTIVLTHGTSGSISDVGAGVAKSGAVVYPVAADEIVLHDSIMIADNQDANLGALRRGRYYVEFLSTTSRLGIVTTDGTVTDEYMEINSTDEENVSVVAATSDTVTAAFVSNGDLILRNGADIPVKIRVSFVPQYHSGLDQDGALCLYAKAGAGGAAASDLFKDGSLRLKNRLGATKSFDLSRIA